jgi:protease-4
MSETHVSAPPATPTQTPARKGGTLFGCAFNLSLLLNVVIGVCLVLAWFGIIGKGGLFGGDSSTLVERHYAGDSRARDKIAVIHIDGVLLEGLLGHAHRQIDTAARDQNVKAVVLRINSPGGSITASDDLHRRVVELRDGNPKKNTSPKSLIVSMGSIAASGGYYIAMPAQTIYAEQTTLTGSIGVFASFPNVKGFADHHQIGLTTIKQGEIKDSGSPFKEMTAKEKQVWQDMVDHAYEQFVGVVETGRKQLKGKMLEPIEIQPVNAGPVKIGQPRAEKYTRYRADGGIFTADKAEEFNLIDKLGTLDDAVEAARDAAQLSEKYRVIEYNRPRSLADLILGAQAPNSGTVFDPTRLKNSLAPRIWYLAPGYEFTGMLAAAEQP